MEMCTCSSTCLLALLLLFSVQGLAVVARVRLSSTHYVVLEQQQNVCIDVINDEYTPETIDFTVDYSYSTTLSGISGSTVRTDQLFFSRVSNTAQFCILHKDNTIPCEPNVTGAVHLTGSSSVDIGQPSSAIVTIQDDDFLNASFVDAVYTLVEGRSSNETVAITSNARTVMLEILQESTNTKPGMIGRSLIFETMDILLQNMPEGINLDIQDDDIALEDPEEVVLKLSVPPQASCSNVDFSPLKSTRIYILDDDHVTVELMSSSGTVAEGETHSICVTISRRIARRLDVLLRIHSGTADISDLAVPTNSANILTFTSHSESMSCMEISAIQDRVIERDESFEVELSIVTILPGALQNNLELGISSSTITIQDTSVCTDVFLDPFSMPNSIIYVHNRRTLCFSCTTCDRDLSWNLTSYQGHKWTGKTGEHIHSGSSLPFRAEVLANGTLMILNSSLVFSPTHLGTLSLESSGNLSVYNIYIQGEVEVDVSCTRMDDVYTLTCLYSGAPLPQITWFADSQLVSDRDTPGGKVPEGENNYKSILSINNTVHSMYTCRGSNSLGSKNSTVIISSCRDITIKTSAISTSTAISSPSTAYHLILCIISLILSHYM